MSTSELSTEPHQRRALATNSPASSNGHRNGGQSVDTSNLSYVENLYLDYLQNPESVSAEWREYFRQIQLTADTAKPVEDARVAPVAVAGASYLQERVERLIRNYRVMGHFAASIDPLGQPRPPVPDLDPDSCGFVEEDMDRQFSTFSSEGPNLRTLREIVQWLRNTYCRSIGVQFMHITELKSREWLQRRMEASENRYELTREQQLRIWRRLSESCAFEEFILKTFLGKKTFSLEGAETLIPLLELLIYKAADHGVKELVLGMAHRGRLNVLASIMGKNPRAIFREFADVDPELHTGCGDVKYHLGYSNDWYSGDGRSMHLTLCFNPSHLEFVNPVAMGRTRAKQDRFGDKERTNALCLQIHGDAAFAGEGIVQETLNLSELESTRIGGTIHVVINNQIGFTTGPEQARSTSYATDIAKMLQIPIFHVNGEDPEAVAQVVHLAMDFHKEFRRDVVIDLYCYRLRGHNEQDEATFTQPVMYSAIHSRKRLSEAYLDQMMKIGGVTREEAGRMISEHRQTMESELAISTQPDFEVQADTLRGYWSGYVGGPERDCPDVETGIPVSRLSEIMQILTTMPADFRPNPKIHNMGAEKKPEGIYQRRYRMGMGELPLDWGAGETLAYASLVLEGYRVRLHGQDVERGTFSHRHAVLHDFVNGRRYMPLAHLAVDQAPIEIVNSALCESGCLGFDYGYSLDCPEGLICWEAQFGDFANTAQVIIDQFIVSADDKWNRLSGLVMLLPHGFEGAGPEHSSARLERFLAMAAEDNIQVACPTTPAQIFHLLRRQVVRKWRKPLIVMSPKSLLRHPQAVSSLADFETGTYRRVISDDLGGRPLSNVRKILLCTGKVYYDLLAERTKKQRNDVAIIRLEQLYPLPTVDLEKVLGGYTSDVPVTWVQEEPNNMGAWRFLRMEWGDKLVGRFTWKCVSRAASASPATGSFHSHEIEQQDLLDRAFRD